MSKIKLPAHLKADFAQYVIHPIIIDGAFQTVAGLVGKIDAGTAYLPFALDELEIIRGLSQSGYVFVELADKKAKSKAGIKKFNIQLLNESGEVLVKLNNFCVRAFGKVASGQGEKGLAVV